MTALRAGDIVLSDDASDALTRLRSSKTKEARSIVKRIDALALALRADAQHGEVVRKADIPPALVRKHDVENLYVEDLPDFWRMLYTIVRNEGTVRIIVVEIADHAQYDTWFPGRGR